MRPIGAQRPRLYGLPKTHKPEVPLRPILSLVGSAEHKLARFLNNLLEPVTKRFSTYALKDSFAFAEKIRGTPAGNTYMVSFDVRSLFTNVPLEETINICADALYRDNQLKLLKCNFIELMRKATSAIEFSFNGEMYRQKDGVAMGSPLGPTLANIFMGYLEEKYFCNNKEPVVYYRYVDDCFVLFNNKEECKNMFDDFNRMHPSIKFTLETENDNKLSFLDILMERKDDKFYTSVFRKKTFTGQYVNYHSYCSDKRKINLIRTLCDRAKKICSPNYLDNEIRNIKDILLDNGFPESLIVNTIKRVLQSTPKEPEIGPELHTIAIKLPFLGKRSYALEKALKKNIQECYNSAVARVIFASPNNFSPASKDPIPLTKKSMVVYHFQCHCGNDYVGKTSRRLIERIKEHVPPCARKYFANPEGKYSDNTTLLNASKRSSVTKHLLDNYQTCGKEYGDERFSILRSCPTEFQLTVCEAVLITTMEPTLCIQREFDYTTSLI